MRAHFERYRDYLQQHRASFPPGALSLATAPWYFDFDDHRCPHDAWLQKVSLSEPASGERQEKRTNTLSIRLLGAYHDGEIEFLYPRVFRYDLAMTDVVHGHHDWRYDEFRLSEGGHLVHEIEWSGPKATGRWLIQANDVEYRWIPRAPGLATGVEGA